VVLWLSGARAVSGGAYPGPERLALMRRVIDSRHVLVISAFIAGRPLSPEIKELMGISDARPAAGVRLVKGVPGGPFSKSMVMKWPYPYYPDFNPHLKLFPSPEAAVFLKDLKGHPTALLKFTGPNAPSGDSQANLAAVMLGFPFEGLRIKDAAFLLDYIFKIAKDASLAKTLAYPGD
jgi:hypothetical protein